MRKTGGDKRRRVKMRIIDCLCKQFFLIANHILNMTADGITKKKQLPSLSGSCFFFNIYTKIHTYFATECKSVLYYQRKKQNDNKHNRHHTQRRNTDSISRICHPDIWYRTLNR